MSIFFCFFIWLTIILLAESFQFQPFSCVQTSHWSQQSKLGSSTDDNNDSTKSKEVDWDWEKMSAEVFANDKRPIVLFDGVCNLCNGGVNFALDRDESAKLRFCSLQSRVAESLLLRSGKAADDKSNIVFVTEEDACFSSDAVSRICMLLDTKPLRWFGHVGQYTPGFIREGLYKIVSNNRYQFGENDSCRIDFDGTYTSRFVSDPMTENIDD